MKALIILLCSILVCAATSYAGDGSWVKKTPITGLYTGQYTVFEPQRLSGEDTRSYNKMRGFVRLNYSRKMQSDRTHGYDWSLSVSFNYLVGGVSTSGTLVIRNDGAGRIYEDYQEVPLPDAALGYAITVTSVSASYGALGAGASTAASTPQTSAFIPDDIDLILELRPERVYNLSTASVLDDISRIDFVPADFKLYWDFQQGAEEYDLEWVFVDKYSPEYTQIASAIYTPNELSGFKLPFELLEPTRVRVWGNSYQLDKTFPEGTLYFRVRPVSTFADQTNGISDDVRSGKWGYFIHSGTLTLNKYEITTALEFDVTKTWMYSASYADDGKSVSTLFYFDGSNRGRQNLTYNTSDNVTLVGESKYDNEGRQTVNVIPAPIAGRNLLYQANFNLAATGNVFDEGEIEQGTIPALLTTSGSAKYFSKNNDFTSDLFRDAIPNANGYVFSQTIFRNDGTGRIERVGGMGSDFQATGTHAARTWYGSTNVAELKRLFGDNVSDAPQGYRKDMVQDANGQLSVTYYDKRGNTIVTALAGEAPTSLRKLDYTEETITTPLNDNNVKIGNSLISEHTFLNTIPGSTITMNYSLAQEAQQISEQILVIEGHELTIGSFCPDCAYKLRIEVKDQFGTLVEAPIEESIQPGTACEDVSYSLPHYTVTLPEIGEYRIIKTLTVDEESMIAAFQDQLDAQGTSSFDLFLQDYLSTVDITACLTDCEDLCMYSVRLDYIQTHGLAAWMSLTKPQVTALIDACITTECDIDNHSTEEEPLLEVDSDEACAAQRERMIHQISPGGIFYDDHSSYFWISLGTGTVTINGTTYTIAQLQDPNIYTASMASALLNHHREYCIWNNHCEEWMEVQNASLYITTQIMNTVWPASAPSSGIFYQPCNPSYDHAYNAFSMISSLASQVVNYGANNNFPSDTYCGTTWPAINSGDLYAVCEALGNRLASQSACLGNTMTTSEIIMLKKQLFLGFYLNIKWKLVKQLAGCTFYDDNNAIFMIPPTSLTSMQTIIDNALAASVNLKSCHEKAIDNVNIWMGGLSPTCLSAIGVSSFTTIAPYNSTAALALQSAYSSSSTSGGLVQLFYNYSRAVCDATTASTPVNPNVLGMFYDPDPTNIITNAPGEVQYDAIKALLATSGCNYSTTVNLPFEVNPPAVTNGSSSNQINPQDLEDGLNELVHAVITCTTCTTASMYDNLSSPSYVVKYLDDYALSNGLIGSIRYAKRDYDPNVFGSPTVYYFEFKLVGDNCGYKTVKFDDVAPPFDPTPFDYLFSRNFSSLYFQGLYNSMFAEPFYGNPDPSMDLYLTINFTGFNNSVNVNRSVASHPKLVTDCSGSSAPSGELGGSFEVINDLIPDLDSQMEIDCIETQIQQATADAQVIYNQVIEDLWSQFYNKIDSCLNVVEDFNMTYKLKEYQYTLYYYDLAGNLVQTVPPQGVHPIAVDANGNTSVPYPPHDMETRYVYNGLNAMITSYTPDGGRSDLYLDKLYRVRYSQNAVQLGTSKASYTKYDELGRAVEAGEFRKLSTEDLTVKADDATFPLARILDYTHTFYEAVYNPPTAGTSLYPSSVAPDALLAGQFTNGQQNLRNTIGAVMHRQADYTIDVSGNVTINAGTEVITVLSYSYDPHKNVKQMVSSNYHLAGIGQQFKKTEYQYDLISGNVEEVRYQKGMLDEYRHRYHYDANNRLVRAFTSHNGDFWELDAKYFYYLHGSLARRELGHDQVQGTDYAYNLQGWLKGVNSSTLDYTREIGKDGNTNMDNRYFGVDAFGFSLGYFNYDYQAIKDAPEIPQNILNDYFALDVDAADLNENPDASNALMSSLYNGNITHMVTALRDHSEAKLDILLNNYQYDQLQRIREMKVYYSANAKTTNFIGEEAVLYRSGGGSSSAFQESYTFDKNGNLRTMKRNGDGLAGAATLPMDNFTYYYQTPSGPNNNPTVWNKLGGVVDNVAAANYTGDIDPGQNQNANYLYNANGQLTSDVQENISSIEWTVTGKVKKITYNATGKAAGRRDVKYIYDPMDRRVAKLVYTKTDNSQINWTYYSYDAGGNTMATYSRIKANTSSDATYNYFTDNYSVNDHMIYGAQRLGLEQENATIFNKGYKNTLATTKDVEIALNWQSNPPDPFLGIPDYTQRVVGDKRYELSNHLGNVLEVITDRKLGTTVPVVTPTLTGTAGVSVSAGVITRTVTGTGWGTSGGASVETLVQGDQVEWTLGGAAAINNQYIIVGLSYTNPDNQATSIKYGWYTHANGLTISESGVPPAGQTYGTFGTYAPGDVLKIVRDNGLIMYYHNGNLKYSRVDPQPTSTALLDFALYEYNRSIYGVKIVKNSTTTIYTPDVVSYADYSPYGTLLDSRHGNDNTYRYGFQGQERDDELKGVGNSYNYEYRMHDPRIGRFFACDPLEAKYSYYSPYQFSGNRVIDAVELEGLEPKNVTYYNMIKRNDGSYMKIEIYKSSDIVVKANDVRFKNLKTGKYYFMDANDNPKGTFIDTETIPTQVHTYWNSDGSMNRQVITNADNFMTSVMQSPENEVPVGLQYTKLYYKMNVVDLGDTKLGYHEYASTVAYFSVVPLSILFKKDFSDAGVEFLKTSTDITLNYTSNFTKKIAESRYGITSGSLKGSAKVYNKARMNRLNIGIKGVGLSLTAYSIYQTESSYSSGRISSARRRFNNFNTGVSAFTPLPIGIAITVGDYFGQKYAPEITTSLINEGGYLNTFVKTGLELGGIK